MKVLLVEDHSQLAGPISRELIQEYGHDVDWVCDPLEARSRLRDHRYDVAVVDLLYEHLTQQFDARRLSRSVSLTASQMLITGLAAVQAFREHVTTGGVVLWTSGEANRRLHLLFAYEDLGIRAYCSKSAGTGKADVLNDTLIAAAKHQSHVDPVLNSYLPATGQRKIRDTLLREESKRAIWRALSLGAHTRAEISAIAGYSERTIGNLIPGMLDDLVEFDPGLRPGRSPLSEVVSYASRNWEFFLDDTVRSMYP
jgi:DNA-binding NarL/FixJ family response regulator